MDRARLNQAGREPLGLALLRTLSSFSRCGRLPVSRGRLLATWALLRARARVGSDKAEGRVLGRSMRARSLAELSYLFYEVFVREDYAFEFPGASPLIYDLGGNIGMATLYFKMLYPGARVRVYEPSPRSFELLRANVEGNALEGVTPRALAVAASPGRITLHDAVEGSSLMTSVRAERAGAGSRAVEVEAVRLSDEIGTDVDFLKMDIEGAELECVEDLAASGKLARVRELAIEYHLNMGGAQPGLARLLALLEASGFGCQVRADLPRAWDQGVFQDVLVRAFRPSNWPGGAMGRAASNI